MKLLKVFFIKISILTNYEEYKKSFKVALKFKQTIVMFASTALVVATVHVAAEYTFTETSKN
jgi:hypothetical protein